MARVRPYAAAALAALLLSSCALQRSTVRSPAAAPNLTQLLGDPAVRRITEGLQGQGFELGGLAASRVAALADAPGAAFRLAGGTLHIHSYRDAAAAAAAADRIVNAPAGRHKWAAPPMLYRCGSAIVAYAGPTPSVASALRQLCASPFYVHPSLREHSAELISEGPGDLSSQVSHLKAWRRVIADQARRRARKMPGGRSCASVDLPESAFLPVEINGDSTPELAVALSQLSCPAGAFGAAAGGVVQFWSTAGGRPRLILEQSVQGFTPTEGALVTLEHGGSCAPAAERCLVTYRWDPKARKMLVAGRAATSAGDGMSAIAYGPDLRRRAVPR